MNKERSFITYCYVGRVGVVSVPLSLDEERLVAL